MNRPTWVWVPLAQVTAVVALVASCRAEAREGLSPAQLVRGFACIHRGEGAWDANTGNGYYGGLQMDMDFQRTYGREFLRAFGTADKWTPGMQIAVAIRAYVSGRGWRPWPNTARACGLL